jgi:Uma2 family endonuclease
MLSSIRSMAESARDLRLELYEQYQRVPEHQRAEIIEGTLYVLPRPAPAHANAASVLGGELSGPFQRGRGGPGGWWILHEPELQLIELAPISPDLAGWRVERMPELPATAYFTVVPDWVCEVLSRSTESIDRTKKLPLYAAHGVGHAWLVDPVGKTLEVYTLGEGRQWRQVQVYQGEGRLRIPPFDAIEFELAALWSPPVRT